MKVKEITAWLNAIAPFETAEGFDNVGLLLGDPEAEVRRALVGMDVTEALVNEAASLGAELILTHHPFIFHGLKRIDYTGPQGRALCRIAEKRISVIAAHTNWDKAVGGVGDSLAKALGLTDVTHVDEYIRMGVLPSPMTAAQFSAHIQQTLHILPRVFGDPDGLITRVAAAGGAYGEGYEAAVQAGAQVYVVGEIAHHEILDACARGMLVCEAGHYPTEWSGVLALSERFQTDMPSIEVYLHTQAPYAGAFLA